MFVGAVAPIDYRHPTCLGKLGHGTGLRMTHTDNIAVTRKYARGVVERFTFGNGGAFKAGGLTHVTAKQVKRATETDTRTGAGFKKHIAENRSLQYTGHASAQRIRFHRISNLKNPQNICSIKLFDRQNVGAGKIHRKSSR